MKTLKESLLTDMNDVLNSGDKFIKDNIKQWLKKNLDKSASKCKISKEPNKDGKYEVSASGDIVFKKTATSLTNGMFIWTEIDGSFYCFYNKNIITFEGSPRVVEVDFYCYNCPKLTSLEGAPKEVGADFYCYNCGKKFTKDEVNKLCKVHGEIYI